MMVVVVVFCFCFAFAAVVDCGGMLTVLLLWW